MHYILQNFCASLSPPSYVIEVQSEAENDWIVELSKYSPRYRSFCSFFRNEFYGSRNLIHLRSLLYICCFFQDFPSICLKVFYMQSLNKLYIKGRLKCKVQLIIYCLNNRHPWCKKTSTFWVHFTIWKSFIENKPYSLIIICI